MAQPWKQARQQSAFVQQWARRSVGHSLPFIVQEINRRMISRAEIMRPTEGPMLSHGWNHPEVMAGLQSLFPSRMAQAVVHDQRAMAWLVDIPPASQGLYQKLLKKFTGRLPDADAIAKVDWVFSPATEPLPCAPESIGLVWSNLWLHGWGNPEMLFQEWARVLAKQGCVFFSCFGPDTAGELASVAESMGLVMSDFADMHDIGDSMAQCGFSDPVMEMEKITLTYNTTESLLVDWRAVTGNALSNRPKGLKGRGFKQRLLQAIESTRKPDGKLHLTLEIVYGHAWKVRSFRPGVQAAISPSEIGGRAPKL